MVDTEKITLFASKVFVGVMCFGLWGLVYNFHYSLFGLMLLFDLFFSMGNQADLTKEGNLEAKFDAKRFFFNFIVFPILFAFLIGYLLRVKE